MKEKHDIQYETEQLLDYYAEKLAECETITEIYELNWYVKDRVMTSWNTFFTDIIEMSKIVKNENTNDK